MSVPCLSRTLCFLTLCLAVGCSPVPRQYLCEAVPNVTLSALAAAPQVYDDHVIWAASICIFPNGASWWL